MADKIMPLIEVLPATPDYGSLAQMADPIVVVTKILKTGTNREESQLVINGKRFKDADEIIKLQDLIPQPTFDKGGPGTYKFEVSDASSGARVAWKIRLGAGNIDGAEAPIPAAGLASSLPLATARNILAAPPAPLAPESVSLGNGWVYNPTYKVLSSPSGRIYNWNLGQQFPDESSLYSPPQSSTAAPTSVFNPVPLPMVNPEVEALRQRLDTTVAALNEARENQREALRRQEVEEIRARSDKALADMSTRMESILSKMAEKPADDPKLALLERKLEEERRDRAERDRLEAMRNETNAKLTALENALRDTNKTDPVVTMLTNFMGQMQQTNAQTMQMMRESSQQQLAVASQNAVTPDQMMRMLREQAELAQNSGSSMINEKMVAMVGGMLDMVSRFRKAESEFGNSSGGVDWASLISNIGDRAGSAIQAVAQMKMREAAATEAKAKAIAAAARARGVQAPAQAPAQAPRQLPAKPGLSMVPPEAAKTPNDRLRDQMAAEMGLDKPAQPEAEPAPARPAPPPVTQQAKKLASIKVKKQLVQLSEATTEQLHKALDKAPDEAFFGSFLEEVAKLRSEIAESPDAYTPDDVAKYVLEARPFIAEVAQKDGKVPIVVEMLGAEQYEYLIDRLLPESPDEFRVAVVEAMVQQLTDENAENSDGAEG